MSTLITNHQDLFLSNEIQSIASPFFEKYNLNYFQYLTVFEDGSFSLGSNHAKWLSFVLSYMEKQSKPAVYSHINADQLNKNTYFFLWEPNLPAEPQKLAREFDIANGLCFVERFPDHYNLIAFASPVSNHRAVDNYLNNLQDHLNFIQNFKHNQQALIKRLHQKKFNVPKACQDQNLDQMLYQTKQKAIPFTFQGIEQYVTTQEYACLKALSIGKTYKEIGIMLNISPRTVESYLLRVKNRFGIQQKNALMALAYTL